MLPCPTCGKPFAGLAQHWHEHPECLAPLDGTVAVATAEPDAAPTTERTFDKVFARKIVGDYNRLHYNKYIRTSHCDEWVSSALGWVDLLKQQAASAAAGASTAAEAIEKMSAELEAGQQLLRSFTSPAARMAHNLDVLKAPYLKPEPYTTGDNIEYRKRACKLSLIKLLSRLLQNDTTFRKICIAKSEEWKKGAKHMQEAEVLEEMDDGAKCRMDPDLMRKATSTELNDLRIGFAAWEDGATFVNPIGAKRGEHKYNVTVGIIVNLPTHLRNSSEYLLLLSVVSAAYEKEKGGSLWAHCGIDEKGACVVADTLLREMEVLKAGVPVQIPDDTSPTGELRTICLKGIFVGFFADWLASVAWGHTPESTSATFACDKCMWISFAARLRAQKKQQRKPAPARAGKRARTALQSDEASDHSDDSDDLDLGDLPASAKPAARTHAQLSATAQSIAAAKLNDTQKKERMRSEGIGKLDCVLARLPGADAVEDKPGDVMHLFGCGLSRIMGAWKLRKLFDPKSGLSVPNAWRLLNVRIAQVKLPPGKRLSKIYPQAKGKKLREMHLDLNASETHLYVMHSVAIIEPLLTEKGRSHPCWQSWLAHRSLLSKCLQHAFTRADVELVQQLVDKHEELFQLAYPGLQRPKNHFLDHLADSLRRFGPFRGFWCMPFEALLQVTWHSLTHPQPLTPTHPPNPPTPLTDHQANDADLEFHVCSIRMHVILVDAVGAQHGKPGQTIPHE
jgi:hypothetical protein